MSERTKLLIVECESRHGWAEVYSAGPRNTRFALVLLGALAMAGSASAMNVAEFIGGHVKLAGKIVTITGQVACMTNDENLCYVFDQSNMASMVMFDPTHLTTDQRQQAIRCDGSCVMDVVGRVATNESAMGKLVATGLTAK